MKKPKEPEDKSTMEVSIFDWLNLKTFMKPILSKNK